MHPDLPMSQAYLEEAVDVLADTELLLGAKLTHKAGVPDEFVEWVGRTRFEGVMLRTPPIYNQDVSLTRAFTDNGDSMYALTGWDYAEGSKAIFGEERIVGEPRVEDKHVFIDRRPAHDVEYLTRVTFQNVGATVAETTLSEEQQIILYGTKVDMDRFSIYSLYKINKLLDVIRADSHLA